MTKTEEAIVEQKGQLEEIALEHEGMRDYISMDIQTNAREAVQQAVVDYDRRVALLNAAIAANQGLMDDGFPVLRVRDVAQSALDSLQEQIDSLTAARAKFSSNEAVSIGLSTGSPEPK